MNLTPMFKHEIKEIGLVSLYFFFCFSVFLTLKKLLLADYQIEVSVLSTAVISALIAAKIVIVLDKIHAGRRFDASYSLGLAALYKTLMYILVTFIVLYLEKLFMPIGRPEHSRKLSRMCGSIRIATSYSPKRSVSVWRFLRITCTRGSTAASAKGRFAD